MLLAEGSHIAVDDLRLGDFGTSGTPREGASVVKIPPTGIPLEEVERIALIEALKMSNWVQKDAAETALDQPACHELQDQDARHRLPTQPPRGAAAPRTERAYRVGPINAAIFVIVLQFRLVAGTWSVVSTKLLGNP